MDEDCLVIGMSPSPDRMMIVGGYGAEDSVEVLKNVLLFKILCV